LAFGSDETGELGDGMGVLVAGGLGAGAVFFLGGEGDFGAGAVLVGGGERVGLFGGATAGRGDGVGAFFGGATTFFGDDFGDLTALINKIMSFIQFYQIKCPIAII